MKIFLDERLYGYDKINANTQGAKHMIYIKKPSNYGLVLVPSNTHDWSVGIYDCKNIFIMYEEKNNFGVFTIPDSNLINFYFIKDTDIYISLPTKSENKIVSISNSEFTNVDYCIVFDSDKVKTC